MADILLTIDVEDWFQVENFKSCIACDSWPSRELRVERNTHRLLDLLDAAPRPPHAQPPRATFFTLSWIAARLPGLVREIHARGHEVASHGCAHELCRSQPEDLLRQDLARSKQILEDITGDEILGFRAPSFSIDEAVLASIRDAGYVYDSSYNSFSLHGRYGRIPVHPNGNGAKTPSLMQPVQGLFELPVSNVEIRGRVLPWGGGAYFRLIPERLFRSGIRLILKRQKAYIMYLHPWELDPGQPRVKEASPTRRFRHYSNLHKTGTRLKNLMTAFSHCDFLSCKEYVSRCQTTQTRQAP